MATFAWGPPVLSLPSRCTARCNSPSPLLRKPSAGADSMCNYRPQAFRAPGSPRERLPQLPQRHLGRLGSNQRHRSQTPKHTPVCCYLALDLVRCFRSRYHVTTLPSVRAREPHGHHGGRHTKPTSERQGHDGQCVRAAMATELSTAPRTAMATTSSTSRTPLVGHSTSTTAAARPWQAPHEHRRRPRDHGTCVPTAAPPAPEQEW